MSQFKNNHLFYLFYTDTDSAFTYKAIDSKLIGNKLGQLKLEHDFLKAVFLAPKVYGGIDKLFNDKLTPAAYIKVKSLKDSKFIDFNSLQKLLIKNNELQITNYKLQITNYKLQRATCNSKNQNTRAKGEAITGEATDNNKTAL